HQSPSQETDPPHLSLYPRQTAPRVVSETLRRSSDTRRHSCLHDVLLQTGSRQEDGLRQTGRGAAIVQAPGKSQAAEIGRLAGLRRRHPTHRRSRGTGGNAEGGERARTNSNQILAVLGLSLTQKRATPLRQPAGACRWWRWTPASR